MREKQCTALTSGYPISKTADSLKYEKLSFNHLENLNWLYKKRNEFDYSEAWFPLLVFGSLKCYINFPVYGGCLRNVVSLLRKTFYYDIHIETHTPAAHFYSIIWHWRS